MIQTLQKRINLSKIKVNELYNELTHNGTTGLNPLKLKETLKNENKRLQLEDSIEIEGIVLNPQQFEVIKDHIEELSTTNGIEDFTSHIYKASILTDVTWDEHLLKDLYQLFRELMSTKDSINAEDLEMYIDVMYSEKHVISNDNSSNELRDIIPVTVKNIKLDFRQFVRDLESIISTEQTEGVRTWFTELLKFGDRLTDYVS